MKNKILLSLLLLLCTICTVYSSINVQSTFITSNDGLGNNLVRHVFQDSKGFLWMSTLNGLTRYDGHSFVTYRPNKKDKITLASYHVLSVSEDKNNFLWIKTYPYYYSCYDPRFDCFVDYSGCGEYKIKYTNQIEMSNGNSWLWSEENGCRQVKYENGKFSSIAYTKKNGKLFSDKVNKIIEDSNGKVWIATENGVAIISHDNCQILGKGLPVLDIIKHEDNMFLLTREGNMYIKVAKKNNIRQVLHLGKNAEPLNINAYLKVRDKYIIFTRQKSYVFHLSTQRLINDETFNMSNARFIEDNDDNLWIYDNLGNIRYTNITTNVVKDIKIKINYTFTTKWCSIIRDSRGLIWIATDGYGLYIYDPESEELVHHTYQADGLNRISSNSLIYITEDRSGSIWLCSGSSGISHLIILNNASHIYPEEKSLINHSNSIRMLSYLSNGDLWIGNRIGTIYEYDFQLQKKLQTKYFPSGIYKIAEDSEGKIWFGSRHDGVCIDGCWHSHQPNNPLSLSNNGIYDIFSDYKHRMWIATFGGGLNLAIPNKDSYTFKHFLDGTTQQQEMRVIASDKNNWMWVGTVNGLCVFHPDSLLASPTNFYRYDYDNGDLLGIEVKSLFSDSKGRMWIGTLGGGLSVCEHPTNYNDLHFTHYTTGDGLVNDVVQSIIEDENHKIWVSTESGISRFTPENEIFENFFFSNSTLGNVYNETSALALPDGKLLFGSDNGLVVIDPEKITSPNIISDVALTTLKINGIPVYPNEENSPLCNALNYTDEIKLMYQQNSFVIEFSTFDYSISNGARYTYKLDNFDKNWSEPSTLNFAAYKNLSPGTYRLHVKACNASGLWSEKEATLQIVIAPPFWKSAWAYWTYFTLLSISLYIAFRLIKKFNTLRNHIQIEKELTEYKLMFFTNISHEFRTPLTLIQGALEKLTSADKSPQEIAYSVQLMNKSTKRMLRLINQLLEFRKMQSNKLKLMLEEANVISFLNDIFSTFEEMANDKQIDFLFSSSLPSYRMYIDKGKLDKIVYNLLSNAFKYTPCGEKIVLGISVNDKSNQLIISVSDTGIGISKDKQEKLFSRFMQSSFSYNSVGIGLHLTRELVNIHKGTIAFCENKPMGAVFTVALPTGTDEYAEKDFLIPSILLDETSVPDMSNDVLPAMGNEAISDDSDSTEKEKILVIEDDNDVRKFLELELSKSFDVASAPDGCSGLEYAETHDLALIICDVLMPGMDGFEVTRKLKSNFDTSHIPIVLLTAMSTPENQLEGVESGADAYITKPFSPRLLQARISQLIEQRNKLRKKYSSDPTITEAPLCSTELDKRFSERLKIVMDKQLLNPDFTIDEFAAIMKLGRTIFFRKVKGITGYTPNEYMRIARMKKAVELLNEGNYNISEITYMVGMKNPYYFSKCFKEQFGEPPSTFLKGIKMKQ